MLFLGGGRGLEKAYVLHARENDLKMDDLLVETAALYNLNHPFILYRYSLVVQGAVLVL